MRSQQAPRSCLCAAASRCACRSTSRASISLRAASRPSTNLGAGERAARLRTLLAPSFPPGRQSTNRSRTRRAKGTVPRRACVNGSRQVICATGFLRGFRADPLLAALVDEHELETAADWIVLGRRCDGAGADRRDTDARARRSARAVGLPRGPDTLAGARYAGHAFLRRVSACRTR